MKSTLSVTTQDAKIITDVVETFWGDGYVTIKKQILRIFSKDITCDHFIMMGQVIGIKAATATKQPSKQITLN